MQPLAAMHPTLAWPRPTAALSVAIVEADPAARERLRRALEAAADVDLVGAGTTADDALALAQSARPDALFVGVHGGDSDVLGALAALAGDRRPVVIVVAEREHHAFLAFETEAADYLLTPFTPQRLERSLARARRLSGAGGKLPATVTGRAGLPARRLIVKTPGHLLLIPYAEIDWIESAGNYVRVHVGADLHLARQSMKGIEVRLDGRFVRVHRGAIVNADRIRRISYDEAGHPWVVLRDGTQIAGGRYIEGTLREWTMNAC